MSKKSDLNRWERYKEFMKASGLPQQIYNKKSNQRKSKINLDFLIRSYQKEVKKHKTELQKYRRNERNHELQKEKIRFLKDHGYTDNDAQKLKTRGWDFLKNIINDDNKIYYGKKYISLFWYDNSGDCDMETILSNNVDFSKEFLRKEIRKLYEESSDSIDMSGRFQGVIFMMTSDHPKSTPKQMQNSYDRLKSTNTFTEKSLLVLLYSFMSITKNSNTVNVYDQLKLYTRENMPELYKKVF